MYTHSTIEAWCITVKLLYEMEPFTHTHTHTPQSATVSAPYSEYCANLVVAKNTLETKRQVPAFEDFLQRCLDSDFSRKIDLWTFLGMYI